MAATNEINEDCIIATGAELSETWGFSPVSFQGWQALFAIAVFLCLLLHKGIRSEVKLLDKTSLILLLPISISNAVSLAAGALALSALSIPIFIAWLNLWPAVVTFFSRKSIAYMNSTSLGAIAVCVTVAVMFFMDSTESNRRYYLFLIIHIIIIIFQSFYMKKVNLQVPDLTKIFYNTSVSLIILLPVSIYNFGEIDLSFSYLGPALVCGFLHLALQIFTVSIKVKKSNFLLVQGFAQVVSVIASHYVFHDGIDPWMWCLIGANWFVTGFVLSLFNEDSSESSQFILVIPQVGKNIYVEKYINYNDMA